MSTAPLQASNGNVGKRAKRGHDRISLKDPIYTRLKGDQTAHVAFAIKKAVRNPRGLAVYQL